MDSNINSINNELNGNQNQLIDENSINNNNNNNNEINLDSINTKKVKLDSNEVQSKPEQNQRQQQSNQSNQVKSRVVHVRNIPMDSTENDLISIAMSFGRVTNCLILRGIYCLFDFTFYCFVCVIVVFICVVFCVIYISIQILMKY
jgi:RNA recognition motif-containing protein